MSYEAALLKVKNETEDLKINCTKVTDKYWIYEGDVEFLYYLGVIIVSDGIIPNLGGLNESQLIEGCKSWFGFDINNEVKL